MASARAFVSASLLANDVGASPDSAVSSISGLHHSNGRPSCVSSCRRYGELEARMSEGMVLAILKLASGMREKPVKTALPARLLLHENVLTGGEVGPMIARLCQVPPCPDRSISAN